VFPGRREDAPFEDLLAAYVRDHLTGAAGVSALARRAAGTTGQLDPEGREQRSMEQRAELEALQDRLMPRLRESGQE